MEKELKHILPIMGIEHDCILSKQGEYTVAYRVQLPEIFTLSDEDYENMHQAWIKAIRVLPKDSVLHKQDWFTQKNYQPEEGGKETFLKQSAGRYFEGRSFLAHDCLVYLTKKPANRQKSSSLFST